MLTLSLFRKHELVRQNGQNVYKLRCSGQVCRVTKDTVWGKVFI